MSIFGALVAATLLGSVPLQEVAGDRLDALVQRALEHNPEIAAAEGRILAAEAKVDPAGTRPDPMLSLALRNHSVPQEDFREPMSVRSIGLAQRFPYPGKLSLARRVAIQEVAADRGRLAETRLQIEREVRQAYYDLVFLDRALEVVARHSGVLDALVSTATVRYAVGRADQEDILQAQVEVAALANEAGRLTETRRGVVAVINRLADRPPRTPIPTDVIPSRLLLAASQPPTVVSFVSLDPGARVSNSPIRALEHLLNVGLVKNPSVQVHLSEIEAQRIRVELAQKAVLPDVDVALTYGQRSGRSDLFSLSVAFPIPLQRGMRQGQWAAQTQAELATLEAVHRSHEDGLLARITELHANLERDRSSLALLTGAMIPQSSAALNASMSSFGAARTDFQSVIAIQAALFQHETRFHQLVTDFAKTLTELEQIVAQEVLR